MSFFQYLLRLGSSSPVRKETITASMFNIAWRTVRRVYFEAFSRYQRERGCLTNASSLEPDKTPWEQPQLLIWQNTLSL